MLSPLSGVQMQGVVRLLFIHVYSLLWMFYSLIMVAFNVDLLLFKLLCFPSAFLT